MRRKLALALFSTLLTILLVEGVARIWVAVRWPSQKLYEMTHETVTHGRFKVHPELGYGLTPDFSIDGYTHNSRGFRGREFDDAPPPGTARVVMMGGSTVYGHWVRDEETTAVQLEKRLRESGHEVEVINAGVPGWTSRETANSFASRVLPLRPDVVVVIDGRNDAYPQLFRGYRPDFDHYYAIDLAFHDKNAAHKRVFRVSHAAMLLVTRGGLFGYSQAAGNPVYAGLRLNNLPTAEEAAQFAAEEERYSGFEANLRATVASARAAGAKPVVATMPFLPEKYGSGIMPADPFLPFVETRVKGNNEIVRRLGAELSFPVVDTTPLVAPEFLKSDCHFNAEGEARLAELLARTVIPLLPK